jgi:hypothetical protein
MLSKAEYARVMLRTTKSGECLMWEGATREGYPVYSPRAGSYAGTTVQLTRLILEHKLGRELAHGMQACHTCDNPTCCRPSHLFEGSHQANMDDMKAKGRANKRAGSAHGMAIFTEVTAREALDKWQSGQFRKVDLCREYGVTMGALDALISSITWKNV